MSTHVKGSAELMKRLVAMEAAFPNALLQAAREEAEIVMSEAKAECQANLGELRSSGVVEPVRSLGATIAVRMGFGGASAPYALYVHEGTKPHFPPVSALIPWVIRQLKVSAKDAPGVAYLVARKIAAKGTAPTKFLERPFLKATKGLSHRVGFRAWEIVRQRVGGR